MEAAHNDRTSTICNLCILTLVISSINKMGPSTSIMDPWYLRWETGIVRKLNPQLLVSHEHC